jgi:hypothetical protein
MDKSELHPAFKELGKNRWVAYLIGKTTEINHKTCAVYMWA